MNRACFTNANLHENNHMRAASDLFKTNYFRMKRSIFISLLIFISCFCSAQTQKGKILIEAGSNFVSSLAANSYDSGNGQLQKSNNAQFTIQLGMGYFIFDNFVFGVEPVFTYYRNKDKSTNDILTSTNLAVGPMVRYYFGTSIVKPLVQASLGWTTGDSKFTSTALNSDTKSNGLKYSGGLGVGFFLSQSVALDGILGYSYTSTKSTDNNSNKTTQKSGSFDFTIGFTICL